MKGTVTAFLALFAIPAAAAAQICAGNPTMDGQYALGGNVAFADAGTAYSVNGGANLVGPLSVGAMIGIQTLDDIDTNATIFGVNGAIEMPSLGFDGCPVVSLGYSTMEFGSVDISTLTIPVGFGVGTNVETESGFTLSPFAIPYFFYTRQSASNDVVDESETDSSTEFGADLGMILSRANAFARAGVSVNTIEDSDTVFSLGIGFILN